MSSNDEKKQLGRILLTRKLVSPEALDSALKEKDRTHTDTPLASFLTDRGMVREEDALRALSEQFGVPGINLSQVAILLDHLNVMPREMAETHMMLPVLLRGDRLFIAMADPRDKRVIDELEFVSGKRSTRMSRSRRRSRARSRPPTTRRIAASNIISGPPCRRRRSRASVSRAKHRRPRAAWSPNPRRWRVRTRWATRSSSTTRCASSRPRPTSPPSTSATSRPTSRKSPTPSSFRALRR